MNADASPTTKISVTPEVFSFVSYDAGEIAAVVRDLSERLGIANPIVVAVDETTPLSKMSAMLLDGEPATQRPSSDTTISIRVQSGALEDTRRFTTFSASNAALSLGRMLLRARDRLRDDFVDAPADSDLSLAENAAWDAYCAGRLERVGLAPNQQRFRYNFRNRFGFHDDVDTTFDRLWAADDLGWHDLPRPTSDLD